MQAILTLKEKKQIVRVVMESYKNQTLTEVKSNRSIKTELRANLAFYNEVKKGFLEENKTTLTEAEGILGAIISGIGNIKDFITGVGLGKSFFEWAKKMISKIGEYAKQAIESLFPGSIKGLEEVTSYIKKGLEWLYKTLSYHGLAKLFAMIRYKTLKPTKEQITCMEFVAKKVYKGILVVFIAGFIIKMALLVGPLLATGIATGTNISTAFSPLLVALKSAGLKAWASKLYSTLSTYLKTKDASKLEKEVDAVEATAKEGALDSFDEAWNKCPLPKEKSLYGKDFDEYGNYVGHLDPKDDGVVDIG